MGAAGIAFFLSFQDDHLRSQSLVFIGLVILTKGFIIGPGDFFWGNQEREVYLPSHQMAVTSMGGWGELQ